MSLPGKHNKTLTSETLKKKNILNITGFFCVFFFSHKEVNDDADALKRPSI